MDDNFVKLFTLNNSNSSPTSSPTSPRISKQLEENCDNYSKMNTSCIEEVPLYFEGTPDNHKEGDLDPLRNSDMMSDGYVLEQVARLEDLAPQILAELNTIDRHMVRVRDLIKSHTSLNTDVGEFPLFSQPYEIYKDCMRYARFQLCELLEKDRLYWE